MPRSHLSRRLRNIAGFGIPALSRACLRPVDGQKNASIQPLPFTLTVGIDYTGVFLYKALPAWFVIL
jgi:hypothetical protein